MKKRYASFSDFYPFYLSEHRNRTCRRLHFIGSTIVLILVILLLYTQNLWLLIAIPFAGYGFAWIGHFFFENNKPATFHYPWYSLVGDWLMYKDILIGKIKF